MLVVFKYYSFKECNVFAVYSKYSDFCDFKFLVHFPRIGLCWVQDLNFQLN